MGPFPFSDLGAVQLVLRAFPGLFHWSDQISLQIFPFFEGASAVLWYKQEHK